MRALFILLAVSMVGSLEARAWDPAITFDGLQELCVRGNADYDYWANRLYPENFEPDAITVGDETKADVMICSAKKAGWTGFTETYVTIFGRGRIGDEPQHEGLFQLVAFNDSSIAVRLARSQFGSSHFLGAPQQDINVAAPFFAMIDDASTSIVEALFHSYDTTTAFSDFTWEGLVFNARMYDEDGYTGKTFLLRVSGETQITAFDAQRDALQLNTSTAVGSVLAEGGFTPSVWYRREHGTHQQSWASQR